MTPRVEILVHVSASSLSTDDARYRRQTQGFLDFISYGDNRRKIALEDQQALQIPAELPASQHGGDVQVKESFGLGQAKRVETIRQLFQRALQDATPTRTNAAKQPIQTPAAINAIVSSALPWTSIKETPRLLVERTPALPRPRTAPSASTPSENRRSLRRTQSDSWQTPPGVILNSQPSQESMRDQTASSPIPKRPFHSSSPSPDKDHTPVIKRVCRGSPSPLRRERSPRASSDRISFQELHPINSQVSQIAVSPVKFAERLPLEIHPRAPPVANHKFISHITKPLQELSNQPKLLAKRKCISLLRPIHNLERGHWLILLSAWDGEVKTKFWEFLTGFIGEGKAGWGVWAIRELVDKSRADSSDKENQPPGQEEVAKIFCWGEVLREVYLVLYIAAWGKRKTMGAKWIDAAGTIVADTK